MYFVIRSKNLTMNCNLKPNVAIFVCTFTLCIIHSQFTAICEALHILPFKPTIYLIGATKIT